MWKWLRQHQQSALSGYPAAATATILASGAIVASIGLAIVVSWHAHFESLLQFNPNYPAMQYNTALSFILLGFALLLRVAGRTRLARVVVLVVAGGSLLILAQDVFSVDLGIDRLLFDPY
ncbi:MAG: hypothetical protein M3439_13790, partial [Chloroflexota bacterium]|nr:hypothetical protein [Chloroflexota bacterium]